MLLRDFVRRIFAQKMINSTVQNYHLKYTFVLLWVCKRAVLLEDRQSQLGKFL